MITVKSRLVWGTIKKFIFAFFKLIYKMIKILNFQLPVLVGIVGVILYFVGAFDENSTVTVAFYVTLGGAVAYALIKTGRKLVNLNGKGVDKKKGVQIVTDANEISQADDGELAGVKPQITVPTTDYPKYYAVRQNKNYVMAEYEDRYLLYLKTNGGLKLIRTDYKSRGEIDYERRFDD